MEEFFHKHIIKFTIIVTLPLWVAWAFADDTVIGYTEHGIPVTKDALEINTFNYTRVRGWEYNDEENILTLRFANNKKIDVGFYNRCWDIKYASALQFNSWVGTTTTFIGKGDKITPLGWTNRGKYPCTIKSMYLAVEE
jgi:hypothetical protein